MSCLGCDLSSSKFYEVILDAAKLFNFLKDHGVLSDTRRCPTCGHKLTITSLEDTFMCQRLNRQGIKCNFRESSTSGTFFGHTNVDVIKLSRFAFSWLTQGQGRLRYLYQDLKISLPMTMEWSSFCMEVLLRWVEDNVPLCIGGRGVIVEIDAINYRGEQWFFGGLERVDKSRIFIVPVGNRNAETLIDIVRQKVLPGTIIHSDPRRASCTLANEGFRHFTMNQSRRSIDPVTNVHIQNIKRMWCGFRAAIVRHEILEDHFEGFIAEFLFRRHFENFRDRTHHFFKAAGIMPAP